MSTPRDEAALQRLAGHVTQRRVALRLHKSDAAKAAGITINTYNQVEAGRPVRALTYGSIEPMLHWAPGSCLAILKGGSPTLVEPGGTGAVISPVDSGDLESDIAQAVQNAAISVSDSLTASEIRELKRRAVEEFKTIRGQAATDPS
ncbi:hypothetical protein ACMA1D_02200 [Streptomyces sp. 796.1]|uniref:hypothetical protein n=1 Tax=Streptomyces sp. 796.1 TaxID=3163029 RepID=UPI0039C988EF